MKSNPTCSECGCALSSSSKTQLCPGCAFLSALEEDENELLPGPIGRLREGEKAGRFRIDSYVNSGASGEVYRAIQEGQVQLEVAIKVMRTVPDNDRILARFDAEREALMRLDHPGIAKVLDAGLLNDGRPFVAMEWVEGGTLNDYVLSKDPSLQNRLKLFRDLCEAVQHAHQKGIVHRDLKPSNILATKRSGSYDLKLIDFGIARFLDRAPALEAMQTRQTEVLGTPSYMSPEQTLGGNADIDVRTDVYALGVILYEVLTGTLPVQEDEFENMTIDEALKTIREKDAVAPSSLGKEIDRDLDAVTLKALAKEPARRYQSVVALISDLDRYTNNEPVLATRPTAAYKLTKFVKRNRASVTAASAVAGALVLGSVNFWYQAQRAREAESLAAQRLQSSEELIEFMVSDLYNQLRPVGRLDALEGTAEEVEAFYGELGTVSRSAESLRHQARAFLYLGRTNSARGKADLADASFLSGIRVLEEHGSADSETLDLLTNLWDSLGSHRLRFGQTETSREAFTSAIKIAQGQFAKDQNDSDWRAILAGLLVNRALLESTESRHELALADLESARAMATSAMPVASRVVIEQNTGHVALQLKQYDLAREANAKAIELQESQVADDPRDVHKINLLATLRANQSAVLYALGERDSLIATNQAIVADREQLLKAEPENVRWRNSLANAYVNLRLSLPESDIAARVEAGGKAVTTRKPLAFQQDGKPEWRQFYLEDVKSLEVLLAKAGQWQQVYRLLTNAYPLTADRRLAAIRLGRAAAWIGSPDHLMVAKAIAKHYDFEGEELRSNQWPMDSLGAVVVDLEIIRDAVENKRLSLPDTLIDDLLKK